MQKAECSLELANFKKHIAGKLESKDHFHFIHANNPYSELSEIEWNINVKRNENHKLSSVSGVQRLRKTNLRL